MFPDIAPDRVVAVKVPLTVAPPLVVSIFLVPLWYNSLAPPLVNVASVESSALFLIFTVSPLTLSSPVAFLICECEFVPSWYISKSLDPLDPPKPNLTSSFK